MTPVRSPRDRLDRFLAILGRVFRFWWVAALIVIVGGALSVLGATLKQRTYRSETVLLYREGIRQTYLLGREAEEEASRKLGLRLKEMALARPRLKQIIDELGLYRREIERDGYTQAIDTMRRSIDFKVREGDTFLLGFTHADPEVAQQVTERLAASLIEENSRYRAKQAETTKAFIGEEKARVEEDLRAKEKALASFLTRHPEFAQEQQPGSAGGAAVRAAQKDQEKKSSGADAEILALEREAARIRQRLALPAAPRREVEPRRDPRLVAAREDAEKELISARRDLADRQASLTEKHPDLIAAKSRVRLAEQRLDQAKQALASGEAILPAEAPPATAEEKPELEARLKRVEGEIADAKRRRTRGQADSPRKNGIVQEIVDQETEWARLNREVAEARERYQALESREFVAGMAASSEESGRASLIDVVDPAYLPTRPAGGGRMKLVIMGLLASLALAAAVAVACAIFDDRLYDRTDVEQLELASVLVTVPRLPRARRSKRRG